MSRGTIVKRSGGYAVVLDLGKGPDGKRIRKWHSGYRNKKEAERARVELLARLDQGSYVEPSKLTVAMFLEQQWLPSVRAQVRPSTYIWHAGNVRRHLVPTVGGVLLQKLAPPHLNAAYATLADKGLGATTVQHVHATIRRGLADAVRWGLVQQNAAKLADPPRAQHTERPTWTASQLRAFLDQAHNDRLYALFHLATSTGMRRGELLALKWTAVDLPAATVSIVESKTPAGRRSIALDPGTVAVLKDWRRAQLEERLAQGSDYRDTGLVFTRENGAPVGHYWPNKWLARHTSEAGLPPLRFHDLRHTHATLALQAGIPPKVMQERLGHASIVITQNLYQHVIPAMHQEAAATIAKLVFG